ncbi:hypothetical protein LPJ77_006863, partial [Coemansia sp. RSA 2523]
TYFDGIQPNFMPQPLKILSLVFDMPHSWDMFIHNNDSNTLVFENLKSMQILGDRFSEFDLQDGQSFMSAPLKGLTYRGCSDYAHMLCQHSTCNLNELILSFDMYSELNTETFYHNTSAIFRNISKIPIVKCTVIDPDLEIDWSFVDWSYLTHLYVQDLADLDKIIDAISAMPYLVFASLSVNINYDTDPRSFVTMLKGLSRRYPKPVSSKLETLLISLYGIDSTLDSALYELKWYYPKLKHIGKV